jgi:hypothetical protein
MTQAYEPGGSAGRWGPLFGARARDWAETWEGSSGYGTPVYESAVAPAVRDALGPFTGAQGRVTLPGWYRVVLARV